MSHSQETNKSTSILKSGFLWKQGTGVLGSTYKKRLFELKLTGKLDYFQVSSGKKTQKGTILLSAASKIIIRKNLPADQHKFIIKTKQREWYLWCRDKENGKRQVEEWHALIKNMITSSKLLPKQLTVNIDVQRLSLAGQLKQARISLQRFINPKIGNKELTKEQVIPSWVLRRAKGLVFLTVIKAGFVFAGNIGTGCVIVRSRKPNSNGWTGPSSVGVGGVSVGLLAGASKIDYIMILPNDSAVKQFTGKGQLRLGGELQLAVGPLGRDTSGSVGAGDKGVSVMYSYSHAQGLYGGLALDGKVISVRSDCNAAFYNKAVQCGDILTGNIAEIPVNEDYELIVKLLNRYCAAAGDTVTSQHSQSMDMKLNDIEPADCIMDFTPRRPDEIVPAVLVFGFVRAMAATLLLTDGVMDLICNFYYCVDAVVVIDNGSGHIKAGYGGEEAPISQFPSVVGRPRSGHDTDDYDSIVIGDEAKGMRGVFKLKYPIQCGIITNYDDVERLWYHAFYNELNIVPEEARVLLTESVLAPKLNRQKMTQIMFENFNVDGLYIAVGETLALYAAGKTSGIVLSSGYGATHCVPIYDGYCLKHAIQRLDLTGEDCTEYLIKLFADKGYSFSTSKKRKVVENIKEKLCYVALDYDVELELEEESDTFLEYELPDGEVIEVDSELFKTAEIMFKPQFIGLSDKGVQHLVYDGIMKCDIDLRTDLFKNIVLCGGNTMYEGFGQRLKNEVEELVSAADRKCTVNVIASPQRKYSQWIGGSILSSMSKFEDKWITKEEYEEHGPQIVHQKYA